jgi:hypothetical protein
MAQQPDLFFVYDEARVNIVINRSLAMGKFAICGRAWGIWAVFSQRSTHGSNSFYRVKRLKKFQNKPMNYNVSTDTDQGSGKACKGEKAEHACCM